jgi:hypothetical protein
MRSKMMPFVVLAGVLAVFLSASSCGNGTSVCPVCGTDTGGPIGQIGIMLVPEHNANGEPGGPFNIFDISWVDSVNHFYYVSDRIGLDVPMFSTRSDIAVFAIGGDNSVAEAGFNASSCWSDPTSGTTIPPITTAQGNYTRFGCKTGGFRLAGFFGPNGHFGGFDGAQCCASRANNLNPMSGPNGLEVDPTGRFLYAGNGSSMVGVFDLTQTIATNGGAAPLLTAVLVSGDSPDFDGIPLSVTNCGVFANGRAFGDPTCGDLRGDELATTGATPAVDAQGNPHDLLMVINGDPGLPFTTIFDITGILHQQAEGPTTTPAVFRSNHCLPVSFGPAGPYTPVGVAVQAPFSPGGGNQSAIGTGAPNNPNANFTKNYSSCILGQIYYDGAPQNNQSVVVDDIGNNGPSSPPEGAAAFPCPDPSLEFFLPPGGTRVAVPSGQSGHASFGGFVSVGDVDVPCHHGPILDINTGVYDPTCDPTKTPAVCTGAIAPAGLGGMVWDPLIPPNGAFLLTNGNSTGNVATGSVDVIVPFFTFEGGPPAGIPVVVNSYPTPSCMPSGVGLGPGTDIFVTCAGHDGRQFAPTTYIMNGLTGAILQTINNVGGVDQGWFNPGDGHYYLAARDMPTGPVLGVIDGPTRQWLQNVPTNGNAHSVAADAVFNKIYVPLPAGGNCQSQAIDGCVGVYAQQ